MAKIILKWRYFSNGVQNRKYLKYIATREGVEKLDDKWREENVSSRQKSLINNLKNDFPELVSSEEYKKFLKENTKGSATDFINFAFDNVVENSNDKKMYVNYIATRPKVEKHGVHGLFSVDGVVENLNEVLDEIESHKGMVFTNIISLKREDADIYGMNCAKRWQDLLVKHKVDIANSMSIPTEDLKWYAAFHDEGNHPHIHLVTYSTGEKPYTTQKQLDNLKRKLAQDIFSSELRSIYIVKDEKKNELKKSAQYEMNSLVNNLKKGMYMNTNIEALIVELHKALLNCSGKKVYGYLPEKTKNLVNGIVDELSKVDEIKKLYDLWYEQKELTVQMYRNTMPERLPLSANIEFKTIKNVVIRETLKLNLSDESNDKPVKKVENSNVNTGNNNLGKQNNYYSNQSTAQLTFNLISHIAQIFGSSMDLDYDNQDVIESKLHEKTIEKKKAQGQKMG